jgi:hypothetical protein
MLCCFVLGSQCSAMQYRTILMVVTSAYVRMSHTIRSDHAVIRMHTTLNYYCTVLHVLDCTLCCTAHCDVL